MDNTQLYTEILQRNKKMLSDSTRLGTVRKAKAAGELIQMRPGMTGGALCFTYFNHWSFQHFYARNKGNVTVNSVPLPISLFALIEPPLNWIMRYTSDRPSPFPTDECAVSA